MHRLLGPLSCSVALSALAMTVPTVAGAAAGDSPVKCAGATTTTTTPRETRTTTIAPGSQPSPGSSCWEDVQPYPFGSEGTPVESPQCAPTPDGEDLPSCYLTVTSMAFRAWNRGLAATAPPPGAAANPFGVWIFNGTRWFPDPAFPGSSTCPGDTIVWAGKRDYWLIGGPEKYGEWASLCRFDGVHLAWEPLKIPPATLMHASAPGSGTLSAEPGAIKSAACFSWDNCWFFGTYGTVVHWSSVTEGEPPKPVLRLRDASPSSSQSLLRGEYTGAIARQDLTGNPFGVAVGTTSEAVAKGPLQAQPDGEAPAQMYGSSGGAFSPLAFAPPTTPQLGDPFRTDLVAIDFDSAGQGWVAGNPAGLSARFAYPGSANERPPVARKFENPSPQPSPLVPLSPAGGATASCPEPSGERFTYTPEPFYEHTNPAGAFLWSSIAVIPTAGEALAGGRMRRAPAESIPNDLNEDATVGEPDITQAACDGTTTVTTFLIPDPTHKVAAPPAPADRKGTVTAIGANATNDAWAATTAGSLERPGGSSSIAERPRLYHLTNGQPPKAPEGDDLEHRPLELQLDPPIFVLEPPPAPEPPEPPVTVTQGKTVTLPSAVYGVKARLHTTRRHGRVNLSLYLTFKLRRAVTIGAQALRHGHVVSVAKPRHFVGRTGLLILSLDRKQWPTNVKFVA